MQDDIVDQCDPEFEHQHNLVGSNSDLYTSVDSDCEDTDIFD